MTDIRDAPSRRRIAAAGTPGHETSTAGQPGSSNGKAQNGKVQRNGQVRQNGKRVAYSSHTEGRLLWWDEVPQELRFNKYIASGYRANLTYRQCLCSLFAIHNETGNVWLHLIPGLVAICLLGWRLTHTIYQPHEWAFYAVLLPTSVCMSLSCAYHLLMAQIKHYHAWLTADICGVFSVMVVPFFATALWGYHCQPFWQKAVLMTYYLIALCCTASAAFAKSSAARAAPMGLLLLVRALSLAHRWWLNTCSRESIYHLCWMEVLCMLGANINVFRIPERWLHTKQPCTQRPRKAGLLDIWGNSHQLMHVLSVFAIWHIYNSVRADVEFMQTHPGCP